MAQSWAQVDECSLPKELFLERYYPKRGHLLKVNLSGEKGRQDGMKDERNFFWKIEKEYFEKYHHQEALKNISLIFGNESGQEKSS